MILVLAVLAGFYFRVMREDSRQWRNIYTMSTCLAAAILLLFCRCFSRDCAGGFGG